MSSTCRPPPLPRHRRSRLASRPPLAPRCPPPPEPRDPVRLASSVIQARSALRSISHDEQLSIVGHLDELRTRLFVSLAVIAVAFGFCFWQNHALLRLINSPLAHQTQAQVRAGHGPLGATYEVQRSARNMAVQLRSVAALLAAGHPGAPAARALHGVQSALDRDIARLSAPPEG